MYIEYKNKIITALAKFKNAIERGKDAGFIQDPTCPSLYLWSKHLEYLHEIFVIYANEKNYKKLADAYDYLEIERISVNARKEYEVIKKELDSYIKDISRKLDGMV